jgi:predicted DNA-binding protein YlxM (UPF0122 family)
MQPINGHKIGGIKMNSNEAISEAGQAYETMTMRAIDAAIKQGVEAGTEAAMKYISEEKDTQRKGRYDRRLRNTRLLLKNYRALKLHAKGAIYNAKQAKESAIDILDSLDDLQFDGGLYIESIKRSQQRTIIILRHIDEMLNYYRISCEQSGREEDMRCYRIIMATYIDEEKMSTGEIAENEHIERRTVYKNISAAIKPISALIFGVDSLKVY